MTTRRFEDLLDECLDVLRAGAGIDDCVAPYPEHAAELREQLVLAQSLFAARPSFVVRPGAQSQGRAVLLSAVAEQARAPEPRPSPLQALSTGLRRLAMVPQALPALLILLALGGTAVGVSAATGSPTAPLSLLLGDSSSEHRIDLRGTVDSVGAASFTITTDAGPQTILITPETRFKGIQVLAELHAGDTVKVDAFRQSDGTLVAREIEREQAASDQGPVPVDDGQNDDSGGPGDGNDDGSGDDHPGQGDDEGHDGDDQGPGSGAGNGEDGDDPDHGSGAPSGDDGTADSDDAHATPGPGDPQDEGHDSSGPGGEDHSDGGDPDDHD
jgi:hypothetical protein